MLENALKQILTTTRESWDCAETRPAVRKSFQKIIDCRTLALGAELYASAHEQKIVHHTCKSRSCPSCGHRATQLWQREQWAALPDIPYTGVVFTMPSSLWPIFQRNRHLLRDLPALGAAVIQEWVLAKYNAQVLIVVVPHTFGRRLNFNAHLHILVSAVGLSELSLKVALRFDQRALMHMWRYAVVRYLRDAARNGVLRSDLAPEQLKGLLKTQYERWWNIDIARFQSKGHFLRYAARYVRRPPIAQHRFISITEREVEFSAKDLKEKRVVKIRESVEDFVRRLAEHVPDHYRHAIRYYGLLAPRSQRKINMLFLLLGQQRRARPPRLGWADSIWKSFGVNPLVDQQGEQMRWSGRLRPQVVH